MKKILSVLDSPIDCPLWMYDGEEGYCMKEPSVSCCSTKDFPERCPLEDYK